MELFTAVVLVIVGLAILGFGEDSRPGIGDDWQRTLLGPEDPHHQRV